MLKTGQRSLLLELTKKIKVSEDRRECSVFHTKLTPEQTTEKYTAEKYLCGGEYGMSFVNIFRFEGTIKPKGTSPKL